VKSTDWHSLPLSDAIEIIGGGTPKTDNPNYWNGDIPWISVVDFSDGRKYIHDTEKKISQLGLQNSSTKILHKGQIIISARGTVGELAVLTKDMAFNQTSYGLNAKSVTCNEFLYYLLLFSMRQIRKKTHGSIFDTITRETFKQIHVNLPPLPEQRAIAEVLSSLDDKIELNRRMNRTLEQLTQAIYKHMFIDNPEREGWVKGVLGDDFNITMGQSPPGTTYNETGEGLPFFQGRTDFGFRYPVNRVFCTAPTRYAKAGDTLVSVRAPVGDINMAFVDCAIGRGVASIRHKTGAESFTYYTLQTFRSTFDNFEMEGTVFGSINKESFHNLEFIQPPENAVDQFESLCNPFDQLILLNTRENLTLTELRDSLLPKLMSGQVKVCIAATSIEKDN